MGCANMQPHIESETENEMQPLPGSYPPNSAAFDIMKNETRLEETAHTHRLPEVRQLLAAG